MSLKFFFLLTLLIIYWCVDECWQIGCFAWHIDHGYDWSGVMIIIQSMLSTSIWSLPHSVSHSVVCHHWSGYNETVQVDSVCMPQLHTLHSFPIRKRGPSRPVSTSHTKTNWIHSNNKMNKPSLMLSKYLTDWNAKLFACKVVLLID